MKFDKKAFDFHFLMNMRDFGFNLPEYDHESRLIVVEQNDDYRDDKNREQLGGSTSILGKFGDHYFSFILVENIDLGTCASIEELCAKRASYTMRNHYQPHYEEYLDKND